MSSEKDLVVSQQREMQAGGGALQDPSPQPGGLQAMGWRRRGKKRLLPLGLGPRQPGHGDGISHHSGDSPQPSSLSTEVPFLGPLYSSQTARMTGEAGLENRPQQGRPGGRQDPSMSCHWTQDGKPCPDASTDHTCWTPAPVTMPPLIQWVLHCAPATRFLLEIVGDAFD